MSETGCPAGSSPLLRQCQPLLLASGSPRRRQLLASLGLDFAVVRPDVDESRRAGEEPSAYVRRLAAAKADQVAARRPGTWVLAADTTVWREDGELLEKPGTPARAREMLASLAGRWHTVLTAYVLCHRRRRRVRRRLDRARVRLAALDADLLAAYAATGEPLDKAGGYALQGVGGAFVAAVSGAPTTVIGLPLPLLLGDLLALEIVRAAGSEQ